MTHYGEDGNVHHVSVVSLEYKQLALSLSHDYKWTEVAG
jgi:hypothetical protein